MARITEMHKRWMKEPKYRKAYEALEDEFAVAKAVIAARNRAGLTQMELARKMGTTQPSSPEWRAGVSSHHCEPFNAWHRRPAQSSRFVLSLQSAQQVSIMPG